MPLTDYVPMSAAIAHLDAAAGLKELRNLWALPEHHERIKAYAKQLTKGLTRPD